MVNLVAVIPAAKAPLEVRELSTPIPGPNELLVKNHVIAFNAIEYKIAKLGILPIQYPAILGSSFGGTIEAVGNQVTDFRVGERVVVSKRFGTVGNEYGAYQRYVLVKDIMVSKLPEKVDLAAPASLMMNLTCVVGLFTGRLGLERPNLNCVVTSRQGKILIYGGSSSFGRLSIQYLSKAGYEVVTTSSPKYRAAVSDLGAATISDHTRGKDEIVQELVSAGPYTTVVDTVSTSATISLTSEVLAAQGGGNLYAMEPAFAPETLGAGVSRVFEAWSEPLYEAVNRDLRTWVVEELIPKGFASGFITPLPVEQVPGGLNGINIALDRLHAGLSGVRLICNPWE